VTDRQTDRRADGQTDIISVSVSLVSIAVLTSDIKKLSCRSETARCFVSLNISLSHSGSLKVIRNDVLEYGVWKSQVVFHCDFLPFHC